MTWHSIIGGTEDLRAWYQGVSACWI